MVDVKKIYPFLPITACLACGHWTAGYIPNLCCSKCSSRNTKPIYTKWGLKRVAKLITLDRGGII